MSRNPSYGDHETLWSSRSLAEFHAGHLQSGPDSQGSSFVSSAVMDESTQTIHMVGTTYGKWWVTSSTTSDASSGTDDPACFYAVVNLPGGNHLTSMDWMHSQLLGVPQVKEGCMDLLLDTASKRTIVLGHSSVHTTTSKDEVAPFLLNEFYNAGNMAAEELVHAGLLLDYTFENASGPSSDKPLTLHGGRLVEDFPVNYPVAITSAPGSNIVYVATMSSDSDVPNRDWQRNQQLDPAKFLEVGKSYVMTIRKFETGAGKVSLSNSQTLYRSIVAKESETYGNHANTMHVASMIQLKDRLIVAGHTKAVNVGWGTVTLAGAGGGSMDGFVTQLDLQDLLPRGTDDVAHHRITANRDVFVTGLCAPPSTEEPSFVYVTGYSKGHVKDPSLNTNQDHDSTWGFVQKVELTGMKAVWTQEFYAFPPPGVKTFQVEATACRLTPDGQNLYVAGTVHNDAVMAGLTRPATSAGGIDLWVAQLRLQSSSSPSSGNQEGEVVFLTQLGSTADDSIAVRGGGVLVNDAGHAIVIGNTQGEMYRGRAPTEATGATARADVFVTMLELNTGDFMLPLNHPDFQSLPPKATRPPASAPASSNEDGSILPQEGSEASWVIMLLILLLGIVGVVVFLVYWNCYHIHRREIATDRSKVLNYLQDFDVEDIELKHSATGGWHCSYANDLAQGVNSQGDRHLDHVPSHRDSDPLTFSSSSSGRSVPRRHNSGSLARSGRGSRPSSSSLFLDEDYGNADYDPDESVITFGISRESRRERLSNYEGLLSGAHHRESSSYSNSRRSRRTASSNTPTSSSPGGLRLHRARERWENREII